jgi:hypothetical protein
MERAIPHAVRGEYATSFYLFREQRRMLVKSSPAMAPGQCPTRPYR